MEISEKRITTPEDENQILSDRVHELEKIVVLLMRRTGFGCSAYPPLRDETAMGQIELNTVYNFFNLHCHHLLPGTDYEATCGTAQGS